MANLIEYIQSQVYENSTEDISGSIMQQVLTRMASDEGVVNVHTISGQTPFADYNNAQAARDAVPAGFKKLGLIITYKLSSGWYIDEFIGSATSGWSTASNWKCLGPISVSQNASTGKTTITIGSESFDVATQPVSVSQNIETGGYNLSVGNDGYNIPKQSEFLNINSLFTTNKNNLINRADFLHGYFGYDGKTFQESDSYWTTNFIEVTENAEYRRTRGSYINYFYDSNYQPVSPYFNQNSIFTIPSGVKYVRLVIAVSAIDTEIFALSTNYGNMPNDGIPRLNEGCFMYENEEVLFSGNADSILRLTDYTGKKGDSVTISITSGSEDILIYMSNSVFVGNIRNGETKQIVYPNDGYPQLYCRVSAFGGKIKKDNIKDCLVYLRDADAQIIKKIFEEQVFTFEGPVGSAYPLTDTVADKNQRFTITATSGSFLVYFMINPREYKYLGNLTQGNSLSYTYPSDGYLQVYNASTAYEGEIIREGLETRVADLENKVQDTPVNSIRIFRRVGCIGDSYTRGYIELNGEPATENYNYAWPHYMEEITNNVWSNFGVSGSTAKGWMSGAAKLSDVQAEGNKCQAYIIGLMINDTKQEQWNPYYTPCGVSSDIGTDNDTYYAWYYKLVQAIINVNTDAKIFCTTCPALVGTHDDYNQAVRDIVTYCYNNSQNVFLADLASTKYMTLEYYKNPTFMSDSLNGHYTSIGYEYMAECFKRILSDVINANVPRFQNVHKIDYDEPS